MNTKNVLLVFTAIVLVVVYAIFFSDWFRPKTIRIYSTSRNLRGSVARGNELPNLIFGLTPKCRIHELKVVCLSAFETNKDVIPVWHMISESNSIELKAFHYGEHIHGMHAAQAGVGADALDPGATYRLFITSGHLKGTHDFSLQP